MIITSVVKSNRAPFMNLAPKELMENLDLEERFALGTIDNDENGKFASGILIFDVWEGSGGGGNSIAAVLKWIYVSKEGRRRGAADAMMKKMLDLLGGNGVEAVICDLPMDGEYNLLCGYLEEWGFDFAIQESYELEIPLRKLNRPPFTEKLQTDSIVPFSALPSRTIAAGTARLKKQLLVPEEIDHWITRCDPDISSAVMAGKKIAGLILVRRVTKTILEVLAFRMLEGSPEDLLDLLRFSAQRALAKYSPETLIRASCRTRSAAALIDRLFPDEQPGMVRRGVYLFEENIEEEE